MNFWYLLICKLIKSYRYLEISAYINSLVSIPIPHNGHLVEMNTCHIYFYAGCKIMPVHLGNVRGACNAYPSISVEVSFLV